MNFPCQGHFWLPGTPDKSVFGTLTFSRREGANLSLADALSVDKSEVEHSVIVGQTAGGAHGAGRSREQATARDGLALGLAQAAALIPGVSRNGATLSAARAGGFSRDAAQTLSWSAGLPVILGASVLKAVRLRRAGVAREQRAALMVGAVAAFLSTRVSAQALARRLRQGQRLWPFSLYRCALAALVIARVRDERRHQQRYVRAQ